MNKIEHIGIAVKDMAASVKLFSALLGQQPYKEEVVESEGVRTVFFQVGETKIELLEATNESSAIHKFIEKKGEGVHHIAFGVDDVTSEIDRLQAEGFDFIHQQPKDGADGKIISFLHPGGTNRVLTELCMDKPEE